MITAGTTFFFRRGETQEGSRPHLWGVISDPARDPEKVLIVNFTSLNFLGDTTLLLTVGDHPYLIRATCVNYLQPKIFTLAQLVALEASGGIRIYDHPLGAELLKRMRDGAGSSPRIHRPFVKILEDQGLLAPTAE